jgi:hypothetical protein
MARFQPWANTRNYSFKSFVERRMRTFHSMRSDPCSAGSGLLSIFAGAIISSRVTALRKSSMQPKGAQAKAYQVKQIRQVILKYRLGGETDEA